MALITCPECKKQVSSAAATCPNCGHPIAGAAQSAPAAQPKKKTSPLVWVIAVIIGLAFIGTWQRDLKKINEGDVASVQSSVQTAQTSRATAAPARPILKVSPGQLLAGYRANEVNEDDQLSGHEVEVAGSVSRISKGLFDEIVVELDTGEQLNSLRAYMLESNHAAAAALSQGQNITIRCKSFRFSVGSPTGSDCYLL